MVSWREVNTEIWSARWPVSFSRLLGGSFLGWLQVTERKAAVAAPFEPPKVQPNEQASQRKMEEASTAGTSCCKGSDSKVGTGDSDKDVGAVEGLAERFGFRKCEQTDFENDDRDGKAEGQLAVPRDSSKRRFLFRGGRRILCLGEPIDFA